MERVSRFLKGSAAISLGTVIGGAISYLFNVLMGRFLGPDKFGDLGAINSMLVLVTALGSAILTITMHYSGSLFASGRLGELKKLHSRFTRSLFMVGVGLTIFCILLSGVMAQLFSINNTLALILALFSITTSFLVVVNRGILQGTQRFLGLSLSSVVELALKLVLALVFVSMGYSLIGVVLSIILSSVFGYLFSWYLIKDLITDTSDTVGVPILERGDVIRYSWPTLVSAFLLLLVMNLDVILAKRYFDANLAGQYIAVSTIAKIIFYLTSPISSVMFPIITQQRTRGEKHYSTLVMAAGLTLAVSLAILPIFSLYKDTIIVSLYGAEYSNLTFILPAATVLVILLSLMNLMTNYFLSIGKFAFIALYIIALTVELVLISRNHSSVTELVRSLQYSVGGLLLAMMVYYLIMKRAQILGLILKKNA